jgi:ABC-type multidrug transport system fused ATPase/permease subunit
MYQMILKIKHILNPDPLTATGGSPVRSYNMTDSFKPEQNQSITKVSVKGGGISSSRVEVPGESARKAPSVAAEKKVRLETRDLTVMYGTNTGVKNVNMLIYSNEVLALIGPSGCGKTTYLRALNRMHDLTRMASVTGQVLLDGKDIYHSDVNPVNIRRRIGMVFQSRPPFDHVDL